VEATSPAGATVVFDGSASSDPDHDALTFTWSGAFGVLSGMKPSVVLPLGVHTIALAVDDGHGHTAVSATHVTVRDTVAPAITIASPSGTYLIGQAAVASYSCADGGAGVLLYAAVRRQWNNRAMALWCAALASPVHASRR
jgi:hypothetical protein